MNDRQIESYISNHMDYIESALGIMKGRMPQWKIDDMRQELLITMLKCLRRYNPLLNNTFDTYVIKSIMCKAAGLLKEYRERKTLKKFGIVDFPLSTDTTYSATNDDNLITENHVPEEERWCAKILSNELLSKLPPDLRDIVSERMCGGTLQSIGDRHGISYETVRYKITAALVDMRIAATKTKRQPDTMAGLLSG